MKVFVAVETFQGVVHNATAYMTEESARFAENAWLEAKASRARTPANASPTTVPVLASWNVT